MQELKKALLQEQHRVDAFLHEQIMTMPELSRPIAAHVLQAGGKRIRPFLTILCGRAFNPQADHNNDLVLLGAAVEMLHAATLLHDDILDDAKLRRGKPAAHTKFSATSVILAGDAMLAKALLMVSSLDDARLTACISEAVMRTAEGELAEFTELHNPCLEQETYLNIITGKTAWMLRASCELGALYAGAPPEKVQAAATFGLEAGIAFQMVDDALDFSPAEITGKPCGGDIREGKATPPFLSYLYSLTKTEQEKLQNDFQNNALTPEDAEALCTAIYEGGFAQQTRSLAAERLNMAASCLKKFPACNERILLEKMLGYIKEREK